MRLFRKEVCGIKNETKGLLQEALALSVPVMLEEALSTAVGYVDTAMVGRIGPEASAAVGMTTSVTWLVNSPLWAVGVAVMAVVARAMGAGDESTARKTSVQALYIALGLGLLIGAATVSASPYLPDWMGAEESLKADASAYFRIVCLPMVFRALLVILGYVLRAAHEVRLPMIINIGVNLLNVILNRFFIFGNAELQIGSFAIVIPGFGLGVRGAAIATALSVTAGGLVMLFVLFRHPAVKPDRESFVLDRGILLSIAKIGLPAGLTRIGTCLGHVVFASQVTRLGTTALAAHTLALTAEEAFYIPGYGMQTATATLCGNALGEQNEEKFRSVSTIMMTGSALLMTMTGMILFTIPRAMMSIFTEDAEVILLGAAVLRLVAFSEPFFGMGIILDGVFDGIGETKVPLICSVATMWGIRILFTWICVSLLGLGLQAVWGCMVANNLMKTVTEFAVFLSGKWKKYFQKATPEAVK